MARFRFNPGRFFWKLFLGNAALMVLLLVGSVWLILAEFDRLHLEDLTASLLRQASAMKPLLADRFDDAHRSELDEIVKSAGSDGDIGPRVTLVRADGSALADSMADPAEMESHADRPEIQQALAEGVGQSTRWSETVSRDMKYVALRVGPADACKGVLRLSMAVRTVGARLESARFLAWRISLITFFAAIFLALGLARLWSVRIARLTAAARSVASGDLSSRIHVAGRDEVALLARSLNRMRQSLSGQLETIDRHTRTLEALLGQLLEGVVVVGPDGRIVLMNAAAVRLMKPPRRAGRTGFEGRSVEECIAQHELQAMLLPPGKVHGRGDKSRKAVAARIGQGTADPDIREARIELLTPEGTISVLARASDIVLPGIDGSKFTTAEPTGMATGRLLVLTDITELTQAIQMKSDFVANASHELRTPLSAVRAAVETLLSIDLESKPEAARRFLEVVERHASRLEALVADLLNLSKVESPGAEFKTTPVRISDYFEDLRSRWADTLENKQIEWHCELPRERGTLAVKVQLLDLVLDNLVENGIKYADRGGRVNVRCRIVDAGVAIDVIDNGCGIAPDEQERVFERFYQVARSRSGTGSKCDEVRGTGLGLSIVKHAVAAMKGRVELESAVGQGTRVTVIIPQPRRTVDALDAKRPD